MPYLFSGDIEHRLSILPDLAAANQTKAAAQPRAALQGTSSILLALGQPSRFPSDLTPVSGRLDLPAIACFFVVRFTPAVADATKGGRRSTVSGRTSVCLLLLIIQVPGLVFPKGSLSVLLHSVSRKRLWHGGWYALCSHSFRGFAAGQ